MGDTCVDVIEVDVRPKIANPNSVTHINMLKSRSVHMDDYYMYAYGVAGWYIRRGNRPDGPVGTLPRTGTLYGPYDKWVDCAMVSMALGCDSFEGEFVCTCTESACKYPKSAREKREWMGGQHPKAPKHDTSLRHKEPDRHNLSPDEERLIKAFSAGDTAIINTLLARGVPLGVAYKVKHGCNPLTSVYAHHLFGAPEPLIDVVANWWLSFCIDEKNYEQWCEESIPLLNAVFRHFGHLIKDCASDFGRRICSSRILRTAVANGRLVLPTAIVINASMPSVLLGLDRYWDTDRKEYQKLVEAASERDPIARVANSRMRALREKKDSLERQLKDAIAAVESLKNRIRDCESNGFNAIVDEFVNTIILQEKLDLVVE